MGFSFIGLPCPLGVSCICLAFFRVGAVTLHTERRGNSVPAPNLIASYQMMQLIFKPSCVLSQGNNCIILNEVVIIPMRVF